MHALGQLVRRARAASGVWEDEDGVAVESPVTAQVLHHLGSERNHAILVPLAAAHHQLALVAKDVVDGKRKAFGEPQPGTVDEFYRDAIAPQTDGSEQAGDLLASEHGGEFVMVADAELGKELPLGAPKHLDEEEPGAGGGLADRLGLPALARLNVKKVVAEMVFAEGGGIRSEMLMNQPHGAVVAVPGARGVVAQGEQLGIAPHGVIRMVVVERIAQPLSGPDVEGVWVVVLWAFGVVHSPSAS